MIDQTTFNLITLHQITQITLDLLIDINMCMYVRIDRCTKSGASVYM